MDSPSRDPRNILAGQLIGISEGYADQPYVVRTDDGAWLCAVTTGTGVEGAPGQHIVTARSLDRGATWQDRCDVEPPDGPEASYSVLLKAHTGRIYCFYNHNTDRVTEVLGENGERWTRVDSLGHYVFRYSEDHGRTWSPERYDVPVREFACDRDNVYGGALRYFWNVGRPLIVGDVAYLIMHKVGALGEGFFAQSEGAILRSPNLLTEPDPTRLTFETLPDGDTGLRTPPGGGRVSEEQSLTVLDDGSLFCVYRTVDGWPTHTYSRDGGHTWREPAYLTYTPGGRRVKHPRAANFIWRLESGGFLYWFHNHGGTPLRTAPGQWNPYEDRNPVWLSFAREVPGPDGAMLEFSQPEVALYDDDPYTRISYPDLVQEPDGLYLTETQKTVARVHALDPALIQGLCHQWDPAPPSPEALLLDWTPDQPNELSSPVWPPFSRREQGGDQVRGEDLRAGLTLEAWLNLPALDPGQVLLDTRDATGRGVALLNAPEGRAEIILNDGRQECRWDSDPGCLQPGRDHHLAVVCDGGPRLILFIVDGVLCDGGDFRQFGWGRFSPTLRDLTSTAPLRTGPLQALRLWGRPLRVSEAVRSFRAGPHSLP